MKDKTKWIILGLILVASCILDSLISPVKWYSGLISYSGMMIFCLGIIKIGLKQNDE